MDNLLYYGNRKVLRTEQAPYSDNVYEEIPFVCDASVPDDKLMTRISWALNKRFPPRHHAGCGYSCTLVNLYRDTPTNGRVHIVHYHGIGD